MYKFCKNAILLLLVASLAASCGGGTSVDTTAAPDAADTTEAAAEVTSGVPEGKTFGGAAINILYAPTQENDEILFAAEEENGDVLNDTVFRRNATVMDKLDVELAFSIVPVGEIMNTIRASVQAGDDQFNMITAAQYQVIKLINEGMYLNLIDTPYIDITKPWWAEKYTNNLNIGSDRRYFLAGDITPLFLRWISCVYVNKIVYENNHGSADSMLQTVIDGKWTFDKLEELTKDVFVDINNNGSTDAADMVGYGLMKSALCDAFFYNAGGTVIEFDKDGLFSFKPVTDRTISIMEKMYKLYYESPQCYCCTTSWDALNKECTAKFAADEMMFQFGYFFTSDYLRDMKSDYSVIPYPKLEESDDYRALVHNDVAITAVPVTCGNVEAVSAVMEELAFQGYQTIAPIYYEIVLKGKYMRDSSDTAALLIDLIRESAYTDTAYVFATQTGSVGYSARHLIDKSSADIASHWASIQPAAEEALAKLYATYTTLK
ncbi:MAG: hypothetical protein IJF67_17835 [Clostridia bacterium]|nr:hypothetical protein [Clostridia bacterium]